MYDLSSLIVAYYSVSIMMIMILYVIYWSTDTLPWLFQHKLYKRLQALLNLAFSFRDRFSGVLRYYTLLDRQAITPSKVCPHLRLPAPENPAELPLVRLRLSAPPLSVERSILFCSWVELGYILKLRRSADAAFTNDYWQIITKTERVVAGSVEV